MGKCIWCHSSHKDCLVDSYLYNRTGDDVFPCKFKKRNHTEFFTCIAEEGDETPKFPNLRLVADSSHYTYDDMDGSLVNPTKAIAYVKL